MTDLAVRLVAERAERVDPEVRAGEVVPDRPEERVDGRLRRVG